MNPRPLDFRFNTFSQLCGTTLNGVPFTAKELKTYCDKETSQVSSYHTRYNPNDVRTVREKAGTLYAKQRYQRKDDARKLPENFPPVIATRISKGGTGKTTVTGNVGTGAAMLGYRVLLIDADPQGSLSTLMGLDIESPEIIPFSRVVEDGMPPELASIRCYENTFLDILPADTTMWLYESKLLNVTNREGVLVRYFRKYAQYLSDNYDLIIIDTNPGLPMLNMAICYAADLVMPVAQLDGMSAKSMGTLSANLYELREAFEHQPEVLLVANGYHPTYGHIKANLTDLVQNYRDLMSETIISQYTGFSRQINAVEHEKSHPLVVMEPRSTAAASMIGLATDVLMRLGIMPKFGTTTGMEVSA